MRDPTGITFVQWPVAGMPAKQFIDWQGRVIHIQPDGWIPVAACHFVTTVRPPVVNVTLPPPGHTGLIYQNNDRKIPDQFVRHGNAYLPPLMASEEAAKDCFSRTGGNRQAFADCLNSKMLNSEQKAAYDCYKQTQGDEVAFGLCVVKLGMGENERRAVNDLHACYKQHGRDYRQYPTCYFANSNDPNVARAAQCLQKQTQSPNASLWSFAGCYGAGALGANAEMQVAVECAISTGGEPISFAGCAGGRLTAGEIDKCWSNGIGGANGCFGPNNTIVQGLKKLGVDTDRLLNRNGAIIHGFNTVINDLKNGPGPNNTAVKIINDVGREIQNAQNIPNKIKDEANNALKRIGISLF